MRTCLGSRDKSGGSILLPCFSLCCFTLSRSSKPAGCQVRRKKPRETGGEWDGGRSEGSKRRREEGEGRAEGGREDREAGPPINPQGKIHTQSLSSAVGQNVRKAEAPQTVCDDVGLSGSHSSPSPDYVENLSSVEKFCQPLYACPTLGCTGSVHGTHAVGKRFACMIRNRIRSNPLKLTPHTSRKSPHRPAAG